MGALKHIVGEIPGFKYTTAIAKLRKLTKRFRIVPGGTSAGKTYGILPILIDRAAKTPNLEISVVSESIPHLRKGALKDFLKIMKVTGRYIDANYNRTLLTYQFSNGSYIEFFSADQEEKVRGPRRNILYVNEANAINFDTFHNLAIRTDLEIWLDFNPSREFWAHTELAEYKEPDADWLTLTYEDNEALSPAIVKEIEKAKIKAFINPNLEPSQLLEERNIKSNYWANWWKVYGLGLVGSLEGVIFSNWTTINELPKAARLLGYGMDFGWSNDPSTLVSAWVYEGKVIWKEHFYQSGLKTREIAELMRKAGVRKTDFVTADRSNGRLITELEEFGFKIRKSESGPGSIELGIETLLKEEFLVTADSVNMINELRNYCYEKDKTGKTLNEPIDDFNHAIDPMRYLAYFKLSAQKSRKRGVKRRN